MDKLNVIINTQQLLIDAQNFEKFEGSLVDKNGNVVKIPAGTKIDSKYLSLLFDQGAYFDGCGFDQMAFRTQVSKALILEHLGESKN